MLDSIEYLFAGFMDYSIATSIMNGVFALVFILILIFGIAFLVGSIVLSFFNKMPYIETKYNQFITKFAFFILFLFVIGLMCKVANDGIEFIKFLLEA